MILDHLKVSGAGPTATAAKRLEEFFDRWRDRAEEGKVVIVVADDSRDVFVFSPPKALA